MKNTTQNNQQLHSGFSLLSPKELAVRVDQFKILPVLQAVVHLSIKRKTHGFRKAKAVKTLIGLNGISKKNGNTKLFFEVEGRKGSVVKLQSTALQIADLIVLQKHGVRDFLQGIVDRDCHLTNTAATALKTDK